MSPIDLLGAPLAEAALLVGIHTWLGLHVLRRGVIFVDLALAQVVALGALVGLLVGIEPGSVAAVAFTLVFALLGAMLLSALRPAPGSRVPQEALIGLVYALAAALALLVMAKVPEGSHHLAESLSGTLLWVSWDTVLTGVWVYGGVGVVHWLARRPLTAISDDAEAAAAAGLNVAWWDLVFYGTFAVVVTHSVATAGVLLVFVFLVAPATLATLFVAGLRNQLLVGWAVGLIVCVSGLGLSLHLDLPGGPTVVGVYAVALALVGVTVWLRRAGGGSALARRAILLLVVVGGAVGALTGIARFGKHVEPQLEAVTDLPRHGPLVEAVEAAALPEEKEAACADAPPATIELALTASVDTLARIALARCLGRHDSETARRVLDGIAGESEIAPFLRDEARRPLTAER